MSTKHWSDLQILVFERRAFRLKIRYLSHWDSIRDNNFYNNLLQLPTVLFGAISSTAAFTSLEEKNECIIIYYMWTNNHYDLVSLN